MNSAYFAIALGNHAPYLGPGTCVRARKTVVISERAEAAELAGLTS